MKRENREDGGKMFVYSQSNVFSKFCVRPMHLMLDDYNDLNYK